MPDETVLYQAKFHWFYTAASIVILAFWMGFGTACQQFIHFVSEHVFGGDTPFSNANATRGLQRMEKIPLFVSTFVGLTVVVGRVLRQLTTEVYVTNKRLLFKTGVLAVQVPKMSLKEINYCTVRQSWLGSLLGYGGLEIFTFTQDDKNIILPAIAQPHAFTKALEMAKENLGGKNLAKEQGATQPAAQS